MPYTALTGTKQRKQQGVTHMFAKINKELKTKAAAMGLPEIVVKWISQGQFWDMVECGKAKFSSPARQAEVENLVAWYNNAIEQAEFARQDAEFAAAQKRAGGDLQKGW